MSHSLDYQRPTPRSDPAAEPPRALHVLAWVTACCVFPLIFMGGLVTSHKAGLAVPDWPNSYGYNMFLYPPSQWVGGIFYEHTHRLLGTLVGFCSILLVVQAYAPARNPATRYWLGASAILSALIAAVLGLVLVTLSAVGSVNPVFGGLSHTVVGFLSLALILGVAWFPRVREQRTWVRHLTLAVLAAVILQGVLGGLRVVWVNLNLAVVHGCFAQAFFCLTALMVLVTSRWWFEAPKVRSDPHAHGSRLVRLGVAAVVIVYLQLIAGALMRHYDAGLAIPDLPLAYGQFLPPTSAADLSTINTARAGNPLLHPVTLGQIWLHFSHRVGAIVVTAALLVLLTTVFRRFTEEKRLLVPGLILSVLLLAQITLGVLSVLLRKPAEVATLHVAVGALVLVTTFVIMTRALRLFGWGGTQLVASPIVPVGRTATA